MYSVYDDPRDETGLPKGRVLSPSTPLKRLINIKMRTFVKYSLKHYTCTYSHLLGKCSKVKYKSNIVPAPDTTYLSNIYTHIRFRLFTLCPMKIYNNSMLRLGKQHNTKNSFAHRHSSRSLGPECCVAFIWSPLSENLIIIGQREQCMSP